MSLADLGAILNTENIKQTAILIEVSGRDIALIRSTFEDDGAGGQAEASTTTQDAFKRFFGPVSDDVKEHVTIPGTTTVAEYVLVGMPDDDIQDEDEFLLGGERYSVAWVDPNQDYQVKAFVVRVT